jgi:cysteine desulfurase/selenocysteine lyase
MPVNAQALGVDWLVVSGHKMCGPTGIGFLWGKYEVLSESPPWQGGGEMIDEVFLTHSTFSPPPGRFEAGTPPIAQAVGLGAACDFLSSVGMERIHNHELKLGRYLWNALGDSDLGGLIRYGPSPDACSAAPWTSKCERGALLAFSSPKVHASDLTYFLDQEGVAVRSGHHCTQPLHRDVFEVGASTRASMYLYNDKKDVDVLCAAIKSTIEMLDSM